MLCKVCRYIRRYPHHRIDQLLDEGASYRSIAARFPGVGTDVTLANHHKHHWKNRNVRKKGTLPDV